jgi:peptidoglycan/xylan/chitin deacetylase (PgdA/CDA1 family)
MLPIVAGAVGLGAGIAAWGAFHPASQLFGPTIRFTGRKGAVALTFDDGPNPAATPRLLDLLDRNGVRATFFLIGRHVRACPQLAAEIAARGHVLANHTETHPRLTWLSTQSAAGELQRCQEAIEKAAGHAPEWMRPPYGARGPQVAAAVRQAGLRAVVMWSVWARDWKPQPPQPVIERLREVRGGDIVVLHDGAPGQLGADRSHTVAALEHWLPRWKEAGLEFVTLDEIAEPK